MLGFFKKKKKKDEEVKIENKNIQEGSEGKQEDVNSQGDNQLSDGQQSDDNRAGDNQKSDDQSDDQSQDNQSDDDVKASKNDMMSAAMAGMLGGGGDISEMLKNIDTSGMSMKEKMGLKMLQKMPKKKQEEILRQALNPQELYKHKDKVLQQIDAMVEAGQIDKGQAEAVKAQMGLR